MRFEDVKDIVKKQVRLDFPQEDTVLMKERGLYCFLLRCKRDETEPFMEWAVETVLSREVRKLGSALEGKDGALVMNDKTSHDMFARLVLYLLSEYKFFLTKKNYK